MVEIFNALDSFDKAVIFLILIAIILDMFLFKKHITDSIQILKSKEFKNTQIKTYIESDVKKYKKISVDSRNTLIVYSLIGFTILTLTSNLILIIAALFLIIIGLSKYIYFKQVYKTIYEFYLDILDIKKF